MNVKNSKAFTMVELLAAITILGVLMGVAVVGINRVMSRAKDEYYKNQDDNIILAAQSYGQNNTNVLPKNIGQKVKIKLSELYNKNYLKEKVKDYGKNNCDIENSYIEVVKISNQDYTYNVVLKCPTYDSAKEVEVEAKMPTVNVIFASGTKPKATIKMVGNDRIISYSYTISYKKTASASFVEAKNSGNVSVNSKENLNVDVDLSDYKMGMVSIKVVVTNSYGKTKIGTFSQNYVDTKQPKCIYGKFQYTGSSSSHLPWVKDKRVVTIGCQDDDSGCVQDVYTATFDKEGEFGYITIRDKAGNATQCKVQVYVDNTLPSCNVTKTDTGSVNGVSVKLNCTDNSKVVSCNGYSTKSKTFDSLRKDTTFFVRDEAGNTNTCHVSIVPRKQWRNRVRDYKSCSNSCCGTYTTCKNECCGYTAWGEWTPWGAGKNCSGNLCESESRTIYE